MLLRERFLLFGLAVYGDSIKMSLMVGSVLVKTKRRLSEDPRGKAPEKNLEFEKAAAPRDEIKELNKISLEIDG